VKKQCPFCDTKAANFTGLAQHIKHAHPEKWKGTLAESIREVGHLVPIKATTATAKRRKYQRDWYAQNKLKKAQAQNGNGNGHLLPARVQVPALGMVARAMLPGTAGQAQMTQAELIAVLAEAPNNCYRCGCNLTLIPALQRNICPNCAAPVRANSEGIKWLQQLAK
jgi:hypothetical protein